jgi:hypothetical protein
LASRLSSGALFFLCLALFLFFFCLSFLTFPPMVFRIYNCRTFAAPLSPDHGAVPFQVTTHLVTRRVPVCHAPGWGRIRARDSCITVQINALLLITSLLLCVTLS